MADAKDLAPQHLCPLTVPCSKRDSMVRSLGRKKQAERHHQSTWSVIQVADRSRPRRGSCGPNPIDGRDRRAGRDFWAYRGPQSCLDAVHGAR